MTLLESRMSIIPSTPPSTPLDRRPSGAERLSEGRTRTRVIVADAEPLYQAGITYVLQMGGLEVVATASNADDLARKTLAHHPDVAIVDLDIAPRRNGDGCIETACGLRSIEAELAILILSSRSAEGARVVEAMVDRASGFGCLLKPRIGDLEDFVASVHRVARGGTALDPSVVSYLSGLRRSSDPLAGLTPRELEVLELIAEGRSNRFIAEELVVTVAAVERHITAIFSKLGVSSNPADHRRVQAVLRYLSGRRPGHNMLTARLNGAPSV